MVFLAATTLLGGPGAKAQAAPPPAKTVAKTPAGEPEIDIEPGVPVDPYANVAPNLAQQVAKFRPIHISFDSSGLTDREKKMVDKLVDAAGLLDCIYWRQSDPEGLKLYLSLANSTDSAGHAAPPIS